MTQTNSQLNALLQEAEECSHTTIQLYKLRGVAGISRVIASCAFILIVGISLLIGLIFLSIGVAMLIGLLMSNIFVGFMVVAIFYMVLAFLLYQFGSVSIKRTVRNAMISNLLKSD